VRDEVRQPTFEDGLAVGVGERDPRAHLQPERAGVAVHAADDLRPADQTTAIREVHVEVLARGDQHSPHRLLGIGDLRQRRRRLGTLVGGLQLARIAAC
jgi:hypothetical protein